MGEKSYKLKIFLWDQFIRPLKHLFALHNIRAILLALIIVNFITYKSTKIFWILIIFTLLISIIDVIKYWKSGEYIGNYRKEKYPDYRRTIKEIKKEKIEEKPESVINPLSIASYMEEHPDIAEKLNEVDKDEEKKN